jgi:hypothetical protein
VTLAMWLQRKMGANFGSPGDGDILRDGTHASEHKNKCQTCEP